jgi:hypothetical protein
LPKPEYEFFDPTETIPERSEDPETGDYSRTLHFQPGTDTSAMGVQRHDFWEEVWITSGSFEDLTLKQTFCAGMYACRPPGMPHGPWRSVDGCSTFEIRYYRKTDKK